MRRKGFAMYIIMGIVAVFAIIHGGNTVHAADGNSKLVYIIPIKKDVEMGLASFLQRAAGEAMENGADHIIFEMDTPGGRVDAAGEIAELLQDINIPTTTFIVNKALSAGSYIALNTDTIYMKPQAIMGASGVINQDSTAADKKAQSAWLSAMKSAAESKGRDPIYAAAMADPSVDLPAYDAKKGEYLTLDPKSARETGYSEGTVQNRNELLAELGLDKATITEIEPTLSENLARVLTNPVVVPILLSIASLGLIVEVFSPGFGVPGIMGILSLILFFYGHIVAGLAGFEAIALLGLGFVLIIVEFFVPGGIVGLLGLGSIIGSLFLSGEDMGHMAMSIGIAFLISIIALIILFRTIGLEKGLFRHIILKDRTTSELGYVSSVNRLELIGLEGRTLTPLRPSGAAIFDDEQLDVISEGGFIQRDKPVKIIKVEGIRVVVREL